MIPKQVSLALLLLSPHLTLEMLILLWWRPSWWIEWFSTLESFDALNSHSFPRNNLPQPAPLWPSPRSTKGSTVSRTLTTVICRLQPTRLTAGWCDCSLPRWSYPPSPTPVRVYMGNEKEYLSYLPRVPESQWCQGSPQKWENRQSHPSSSLNAVTNIRSQYKRQERWE